MAEATPTRRKSEDLTLPTPKDGVAMDFTTLGTAITCLTNAADLGKSIVGIRDTAVTNGKVIEIQELLLKAQHSLFAHRTELQRLQQENLDLANRLRSLEAEELNKQNYTLVELKRGNWTLATKLDKDIPDVFVPNRYTCQPCFSGGRENILARVVFYGAAHYECPVCKSRVETDEEADDS
jgi:hypothetical protein